MKKFYILLLLLMPTLAYANVGLPVILVYIPSIVIGFIPVVLVEIFLINKFFNIDKVKLIPSVIFANFITTIIGMPIMWGIQTLFGGVTITLLYKTIPSILNFKSPVLYYFSGLIQGLIPPVSNLEIRNALVYGSMTGLFILCFFVSYQVEYLILKKWHKVEDRWRFKKMMIKVHLGSYSLLLTFLVISILDGKFIKKEVAVILFKLMGI